MASGAPSVSSTRMGSQSNEVTPAATKTRRTLGVTSIQGVRQDALAQIGLHEANPTFSQLSVHVLGVAQIRVPVRRSVASNPQEVPVILSQIS